MQWIIIMHGKIYLEIRSWKHLFVIGFHRDSDLSCADSSSLLFVVLNTVSFAAIV